MCSFPRAVRARAARFHQLSVKAILIANTQIVNLKWCIIYEYAANFYRIRPFSAPFFQKKETSIRNNAFMPLYERRKQRYNSARAQEKPKKDGFYK